MYCKECGTENQDDSLRCNKCNAYLRASDSPLTGGDRVKILGFFAFLILPLAWFGGSALIVIIALLALYITKKDQTFQPIINAKKYMKVYLMVLGLSGTIITASGNYFYNNTVTDYVKYNRAKKDDPYAPYWKYKKHNPEIDMETGIIVIGGFISTPIAVTFFMFIFNSLFFRPLEEHKNWIIKNGIFSDEKNKKSNSTNILGRDNLSSYSVADELLKWNNLLEKGLISQEEYEKAKAKLLNEEKA